MDSEKKKFRHGFWCTLTWCITWLAMFGIIATIFLPDNHIIFLICFTVGGTISAIISYILRTIEKSKFENKWSWHIND